MAPSFSVCSCKWAFICIIGGTPQILFSISPERWHQSGVVVFTLQLHAAPYYSWGQIGRWWFGNSVLWISLLFFAYCVSPQGTSGGGGGGGDVIRRLHVLHPPCQLASSAPHPPRSLPGFSLNYLLCLPWAVSAAQGWFAPLELPLCPNAPVPAATQQRPLTWGARFWLSRLQPWVQTQKQRERQSSVKWEHDRIKPWKQLLLSFQAENRNNSDTLRLRVIDDAWLK